jgi:hypothetical protein
MFFSIISLTTDAILTAARNHPEKIGSHGQSVEKIIGSAEKNRVGREPEPQVFFYTLLLQHGLQICGIPEIPDFKFGYWKSQVQILKKILSMTDISLKLITIN